MTLHSEQPASNFPEPTLLPVSAVVATRNRPCAFARTMESLAEQSHQPAQLIVVDSSTSAETAEYCQRLPVRLKSKLEYFPAETAGAAPQRNQGMRHVREPIVFFFDDDIVMEAGCVSRLYHALTADPKLGGVCALITNQCYQPPGWTTRQLLRILNKGKALPSYAGRFFGPGISYWPADDPALPEVVEMEWLYAGCTMFKRETLPNPVFAPIFVGASTGEDAALSQVVRRKWKLANVRTARIFHDHQSGGDHKADRARLAEMFMVNQFFTMTRVLGNRQSADYCRFALAHAFQFLTHLKQPSQWRHLPAEALGRIRAIRRIFAGTDVVAGNGESPMKRNGLPHRGSQRAPASL